MSSDSFQYLSASTHLASTHRMATSLVHFETERRHGTIPAPLTWFPPGYPLAIAAVPAAPETAALLVSIASFATVAAGVWLLTFSLSASAWAARFAALGWIANAYALSFAVSALSESLFTAIVLTASLLLVRADRSQGQATLLWLGAAVAAGLSYWVRYAGALSVATWAAVRLSSQASAGRGKNLLSRSTVLPALALGLLLAPLALRNTLLVGDWRGGNNTHVARSVRELLTDAPRIFHHLLLGDGTTSQLLIPVALVATGLLGLTLTLALASGRSLRALSPARVLLPTRPGPLEGWRVALACLLIYTAGIAGIALRSPISFEPRMYLPVLPLSLALLATAVEGASRLLPAASRTRALGVALAGCSLLGYLSGNFVSYHATPVDSFQHLQAVLREPESGTGIALAAFLKQELRPGEVIAATDGQAVGYTLGHPTLSLVGPPYTLQAWDEPLLTAQLSRFQAAHLLVFRGDPAIDVSPLLQSLLADRAPAWLQPVGSTRDVRIFRVKLSTRP